MRIFRQRDSALTCGLQSVLTVSLVKSRDGRVSAGMVDQSRTMIWDQARKGYLAEVARILQNDGHDIVCQRTALFQTHVDQQNHT
jgi:hypothetical protein